MFGSPITKYGNRQMRRRQNDVVQFKDECGYTYEVKLNARGKGIEVWLRNGPIMSRLGTMSGGASNVINIVGTE